jgi:hypothetical protein
MSVVDKIPDQGFVYSERQFCSQTDTSGDTYVGYFLNGERHGHGKTTYKNGNAYDGEWRDGKREGSGKFTFSSWGRSYEGEWKNDMRDGKGTITELGSVYEGECKEDRRHGQGVHKHENGMTYIGKWVNGEFVKGTIKWPDGRIYNGDYGSIGVGRQGYGTYTNTRKPHFDEYTDQSSPIGTYTGQWERDKKSGRGRMLWNDGISYEGEWIDDLMHGTGTFIIANKDKYVGQFKEGKKHGRGTMTYDNGIIFEGEWVNGKKRGKGTFTWTNGKKFRGEWIDKVSEVKS